MPKKKVRRKSVSTKSQPPASSGLSLPHGVHAQVRAIADQYDLKLGRVVVALLRGWGLLSTAQQQQAILGSPAAAQLSDSGIKLGVMIEPAPRTDDIDAATIGAAVGSSTVQTDQTVQSAPTNPN